MSMGAKNETVNMNVVIAERSYPVKVLKADEEKMRHAVKLVNDKVKEYQNAYAGKDRQDHLAMCLLNFAVENMNAENEQQQIDRSLHEQVTRLETILNGNV